MTARLKDFARLGATLRRVRVADRPLEGGGKKVWHQGEQGAEVISFVDALGQVTRQECYLGEQVVVWEHERPITTAVQHSDVSADDAITSDAQVNVPAVLNAVSLLEGYHGDDKYLEHLRAVLRLAAQALPASGLDPADAAALRRVTADLPVVTPDELAESRAGARGSRWVKALVALVIAAAIAWFLLRR